MGSNWVPGDDGPWVPGPFGPSTLGLPWAPHKGSSLVQPKAQREVQIQTGIQKNQLQQLKVQLPQQLYCTGASSNERLLLTVQLGPGP